MPPRPTSRLAHLGLLYAAFIWGSTFILVKDSLEHIDPVILVGYRFLLAALPLGFWLALRGRRLWHEWQAGVRLGILLWLLYAPQTIGLGYTSAANSAFITGLFVAFVPLFSWLFLRRPLRPTDAFAAALALAGLWLLTGGLREANPGDLITLITAAAYAGHILAADDAIQRGLDSLVLSFQQFLVVGLLSLAAGAVFGLPFGVGTPGTWGVVAFLAFLPTLSAFAIQLWAQRQVAPLRVSLIFALEPVFAALLAWTAGHEPFRIAQAAGGLLIVMASASSILTVSSRTRPRE
ncbi:MAG: DMT family transporter [Anaerolineae bacterium]|nr:MAG: DMT family transporter [Anaerolineae bacterium]